MIQKQLEELSNLCLMEGENYHGYNDEDLINATIVFMHFFIEKMYEYQKPKLNQKQLEELATEAGKNLRQTILLFTNKDMHDIVKEKLIN